MNIADRYESAAPVNVGSVPGCSTLSTSNATHRRSNPVARYHATVTKNMTVRLPDELAADTEALARVEGKSVNETIKDALSAAIDQRRRDPMFRQRVRQIIEEDRELLERLAK
jgi:hypothetical protein